MRLYLDTSLLVPCYVTEPRSVEATGIIARATDLVVSSLALHEAMMALTAKQRWGHIDEVSRRRAQERLRQDVADGIYRFESMPMSAFELAATIAEQVPNPVRMLDGAHCWFAQHLGLTVATFDRNFHLTARTLGMAVEPPVLTPHPSVVAPPAPAASPTS